MQRPGTTVDEDLSRRAPSRIRGMFDAISPRYDFLNRSLSLFLDRYWRWLAIRRLLRAAPPAGTVLDLCTGTGDLALQVRRHFPKVVASDFSHQMLLRGKSKAERRGLMLPIVEGDALGLPFADRSFAAVTIAFGLRNLSDYPAGLREASRLLKPGGVLMVLEFSRPRLPLFKQAFGFYFRQVLPRLGRWVSGDPSAYEYLPASVLNFPGPEQLAGLMGANGFSRVEYRTQTGGVVTIHLAWKRESQTVDPVD